MYLDKCADSSVICNLCYETIIQKPESSFDQICLLRFIPTPLFQYFLDSEIKLMYLSPLDYTKLLDIIQLPVKIIGYMLYLIEKVILKIILKI